jgi:NMD protein affecting ribosome stability and mRNA decay
MKYAPEDLVPRCLWLFSECRLVAYHCEAQAELRELYGQLDPEYLDEESLKLIRRKRHRQKVNLKAAVRAEKLLHDARSRARELNVEVEMGCCPNCLRCPVRLRNGRCAGGCTA